MRPIPFTEPLLSRDEEVTLAKQIEAGVLAGTSIATDASEQELATLRSAGKAAWNRLWLANLRLVNQIAHQEARRYSAPVEDVFQEACVGLAEAMMRYDHQRGARFATFAHSWILHRANQAAVTRGGADLLSASQLRTLRRNPERTRTRTVELSPELAATLPAPATPDLELPWWFDQLAPRQQLVLRLRYLASPKHTLARTAEAMSLSVGQVRRLEAAAFAAARSLLRAEAAA